MTAAIAAVRLSLEGGADLAEKVNPRLIELTLSEKREAEADELSLRLRNSDGALALPETGRSITLALGWKQGSEVPTGLVDKGTFTVDEAGASGPPDVVTVRARSADLTGLYRQRRTHSWTGTTLGALLGEIASRHGRTLRIGGDLAVRPIAAIEQEGKSDMAFVAALGRRYDAVSTWKGGNLIFLPIGASASASGTQLSGQTLTKRDGWSWDFSRAEREGHDGAAAQWHDSSSARRRTVKLGGENRRKLKRVYASEAEARQAAQAAMARDARGVLRFTYDLAVADPALQVDQRVTLQGWGAPIDSIAWLLESIETTFNSGGMVQRIELEGSGTA